MIKINFSILFTTFNFFLKMNKLINNFPSLVDAILRFVVLLVFLFPSRFYAQAIGVTAPAASGSICAGTTLNITFTTTGTFSNTPSVNVFSAQVSDAIGSFGGSPVTIGTLTATAGGTITCTLPSTLLTSNLYRYRVISNNPAINGSDNGADQLIYAITLNSPTVTQSSFCQTEVFSLTFTQTSCAFMSTPSTNVYSVELSNAAGSFTSPVVIGTYTAVVPGPITCTIPGGTAQGTGYRMRVVASNPSVIGPDNGSNLSIIAPVGTPTVFGNGRWNVYCYAADNNYTTNYVGTYTETSLSFTTTTRWANTASPSAASGYSGCVINPAMYSFVYKRTNIPCGYYQLDIPNHRQEVYFIINGVAVFTHTNGCCDSHTNAWRGVIEATDEIELRCSNTPSNGLLQATFTKLNQLVISAPVRVCSLTTATLTSANTGTLPIDYSWTPAGSVSPSTGSPTTIATPAATTTYVVTGTDPVTGCAVFSNSVVVTVSATAATSSSITAGGNICNGFNNTVITVSGANTYSWAPPAGLSATTGTIVTATPTITTTYTITGSNNCTTSIATRVVTVRNTPTISPSVFGNNVWNVYCYNNTALTDFYGFYTENNLSFDSRNRWAVSSTPSVALTTTAGTGYSGCNLIPATHGTISKRTNFPCGYYRIETAHDDYVTILINNVQVFQHLTGGDVHSGVAGGVWTGFLGSSSTVEIRYVNVSSGGYITATFVAVPAPVLSPPVTICLGTSTTFTAAAITGATYLWAPATNLSSTTGTVTTSSATVSTNYTCTITDTLTGCTSASTTSLTINPLPTTSVTPLSSTLNCAAESTTLTAGGANTYSWAPSAGLSATTGYSVIASPTANTIYTVTGSNNCTAVVSSATVMVVPLINPTVFPTGTWNAYCFNSTTYTNYYGYYTEDGGGASGYDFNTTTRWAANAAPSTANATNGLAYQGCTMPTSAYTMSFKRTGFTCNTYSIIALGNDDNVYVNINGTQVATRATSSASVVLWVGVLSNLTTVEIRLLQNTSTASLNIAFVPASITSSVAVWSGAVSSDWFNAANWCGSNTPSVTDDAIIFNSGTAFQPVIGASGATCLDLTIFGAAAATATSAAIPAASLVVSGAFGLTVYGDWINRGFFNAGTGTVSILGTGAKTMSCNTTQTFNRLVINNVGDVTLSPTIHRITSNMDFQNGVVVSTGTLQFLNGATATNASDVSYVEGPVVKFGNQAFTFPIGLNDLYRPVSISAPVNTSDNFTAQYFYSNPSPPYTSTSKDATIDHISSCEHWILNRTGGSSIVNVNLTWAANSCGITTYTDLVIARWDAGQVKWKDHGAINVTGTNAAGSMQSSSPVTVFSPFTLGSKTNLNPLPIELLDFTAVCVQEGVQLNWTTASERNNDYFYIERSVDGKEWVEIAKKYSGANSALKKTYVMTDNNFADETSYYRLWQVDKDQHKEMLKTVVSQCHLAQNEFRFFPNPARNEINLVFNVSASDLDGTFSITDNLGRLCHSEKMDLKKGTNFILVPVKLKPGVYFISYTSNLFKHEVRKLVIQ
ncbi:hypothetical protein CNR22_01025 [Sphingobacteriaceae bacterium]|nr:hypothetical protein CNR22_01025 [Sphingobacteriaceae bacterium]